MNNFLPGLYIVSTPIGNLEDITLRALSVLKKSDQILCEDTRRSIKLLNHYNIKKKLVSNHKFNEKKNIRSIIQLISSGKIVSLISDAGTPVISDPGLILIKECLKQNINIFPIPGASAVTTAMSLSAFDDKYIFYGFLPKIHETFYRADLKSLENFKKALKGEITVILSKKKSNNSEQIVLDNEVLNKELSKYLKRYSLKDVVKLVSERNNLPKKLIYDLCLKLKKK